MIRRGDLRPAHQGYRYQDIATAYVLIRSLSEHYEAVIVDRKQVADDKIDDLEVVTGTSRIRRQFKSSQNAARRISAADFNEPKSSLRIDRLVLTFVRGGTSAATEYRLCATWSPPAEEDSLGYFLHPLIAEPTVLGSNAPHFVLAGEKIWPAGGSPKWNALELYATEGAEFGRDQFIEFCNRFIVELSLPMSSSELANPGPIERALIESIADRVGIGRYPNQGRTPADVAALAVSLANLARGQEALLTPGDVERELGIRTDFGRVAQAFPLDPTVFHDRPTVRKQLLEGALSGGCQIVLAPPGAGKSWELTRLAEDLRKQGALVARHYCYLEPGDDLAERRVTSDVFFGNLISELVDDAAEIRSAASIGYAAGIRELEASLAATASLGKAVVVIVDGLDHIARVRAGALTLALNDTDIVERLAVIDFPPHVSLIIGSQPGQHLDPLRDRWKDALTMREVPPWQSSDIAALARLHGVVGALETAGITGEEYVAKTMAGLAERSDGNPLYARYLSLEIVLGLRSGSITNVTDWLTMAPAIDGQINTYYAHLYRLISEQAQGIADILGVIDFAVTEEELREIVGMGFRGWVSGALARLQPILTTITGQGGVRIFHESFRRYVQAELSGQGRSISDVLAPVIQWLQDRGFYRDAKSYRFLLPALARAGRGNDVSAAVGPTFVSDSIQYAQPLDAIYRNLALAADVSGRATDWPALVRYVELRRAAFTAFDSSQNTWDGYWQGYLDLFGAPALAERLLFDGRPTQSTSTGLLACSLVDDAGGIAPWREYLKLPAEAGEVQNWSDAAAELTGSERVSIARVHGRLVLGYRKRIIRRVFSYLHSLTERLKPLFVRSLASRLARSCGTEVVEGIASRLWASTDGDLTAHRRVASLVRIGLADEYARVGLGFEAASCARAALDGVDSPELASWCFELGAAANACARYALAPGDVPIAVGPDRFLHEAEGVRSWVASVRLLANDGPHAFSVLEAEKRRVEGRGWYRCWLRYVIEVASVEALRRAGGDGDIVASFECLLGDTHPFSGTPRACDLWSLRNVIRETIAWGLSFVRSEEEWSRVLEALVTVSHETGSRLDREDGGPVPTGTLLQLLQGFVGDPVAGPAVMKFIESEISRREDNGTYYSSHADFTIRLARARIAAGDSAGAHDAWRRAAIYLGAYGWRKDITVYEVINSIGALHKISTDVAVSALEKVQPLVNSVIAHTDHKSTNHAPNEWFSELMKVHPATAIVLLATTNINEDGTGGWPTAEAIRYVSKRTVDHCDPAVLDAILRSIPFDIDGASESGQTAKARLAPIARLAAVDGRSAALAIREVSAEILNDARRHGEAAYQRVVAVAAELNLPIQNNGYEHAQPENGKVPAAYETGPKSERLMSPTIRTPAFPANPSFMDLLRGLRATGESVRFRTGSAGDLWGDVLLPLSYRVGELVDAGRPDDARRLLYFFARDVRVPLSDEAHPLGVLGSALDSAGYDTMAAVAYTLAYTSTRTGWGHQFGGRSHAKLIARAIELDRSTSMAVLAEQVAYYVRDEGYSIGIARDLVERIVEWGDLHAAEAAWNEAFAVISHRLPDPPENGWFARLDSIGVIDWTENEALIALSLARLSDPRLRSKIAALRGILHAAESNPFSLVQPLRWWLKCDVPVSSTLLVLHVLLMAEKPPFAITTAMSDELAEVARPPLGGVRDIVEELLTRAGLKRLQIDVSVAQGVGTETASIPEHRAERILSAQWDDVMGMLAGTWPNVPSRVAARVERVLSSTADWRRRCADRYELMYGRDGKWRPATPVIPWEREVILKALNEEVNGLADRGDSVQSNDDKETLRSAIIPNIALHVGLAASRCVRPPWPEPADVAEGIGDLPTVQTDDPSYTGWTRLGIVERQYILPTGRTYEPPTEDVLLFAGAVAVPRYDIIPEKAFPFLPGNVNWWWIALSRFVGVWPISPGQLIHLERATDWLGDALVLMPPPALLALGGLRPPAYGAPLTWFDESGAPAIALRTWRIRNPEAFDAQPVLFEGADLIARDDIVAELELASGYELQELRRSSRGALR